MSEGLSIGELARETGRTVHALRWYERQGLIPGVSRDSGRRRVYRQAHIGWLRFLARLKRTGMRVEEMRTYADLAARGSSTAGERHTLLLAHRKRLEGELAALSEARTILDAKIAFYAEWQRTGRRPRDVEIP
jgi:DNA-binding transcriptional MerR regulator